jgi:hypothetical protein
LFTAPEPKSAAAIFSRIFEMRSNNISPGELFAAITATDPEPNIH